MILSLFSLACGLCVCLSLAFFALELWTKWTVAHQGPLSMIYPRQEYWAGLTFPTPGDLDPGINPVSLASPALAGY